MEAIKNAIGLGTSEQQGREPVSGVTGSGTAGEPYDQGNVEDPSLGGKAPQQTDPVSEQSTTSAAGGVAPNATSATTSTGKSAGSPADVPSTTQGTTQPQDAQKSEPTSEAPAKKGGIGSSSWFSTAIPFVGKNKGTAETSESAATSSQEQSEPQPAHSSTGGTSLHDIRDQPPNTLPTQVPKGHSTDLDPSVATTTTASSDPMHAHQEVPNEPVGTPAHALKGSKASIAPEKPDHANAPLKPAAKGGEHGTNPDAIPTAGGKKIGEDSYTERTSMQADSATAGVTGANTASNTGSPASGAVPQTSSSASGVDAEKESTTSGGSGSGSGSGHKKKHSLVEKIKDKVHKH